MTTNRDNNQVDDFVTAYLVYIDGEGDRPDSSALSESERREAAARIRIHQAAQAAAYEPPVGAMDRLAQKFGFDRAGSRITVSGRKLKAARIRKSLDLRALAAAATAAGVPTRTSDLLRIETAEAVEVEQPLVTVLVAILETDVAMLEEAFDKQMDAVRRFLGGPLFDELVRTWAAEHECDLEETRQTVVDGVLALHLRAEDVAEAQLADFVRAFLRRMEG